MLKIKMPKIPGGEGKPAFGPEECFEGKERVVYRDSIMQVISSLLKDDEAVSLISRDMAENLKGAAGLRPRPELNGEVDRVIMSHIPDDELEAFDYFGSDVYWIIRLYVAKDSPEIRELENKNVICFEN